MSEPNRPSIVTDIWFYTTDDLRLVAEKLHLKNTRYDCENVWEWAIGDLLGARVDLTRSTRGKRREQETAIFLFEPPKAPWPTELRSGVVERLRQAGYSEIFVGRLVVNSADQFERYVVATF